LVYT
jgi:hypothetical protein